MENKEEIKLSTKDAEYYRKYYQENKERLRQKLNAKETCSLCGKTTSHQNMTRHRMTNTCRNFVNKNALLKKQIDELQEKLKATLKVKQTVTV